MENRDLPLLCIKVFETPKIRKARRAPHDIFRHWETKTFRRKIVISPSYIYFFSIPDFFQTEAFTHEIFRDCETKSFWQKIVIYHVRQKFFSIPEKLWNREWSSMKVFGKIRQSFLRWRIVLTPLSLIQFCSLPESFWNAKWFFTNFVGTVRLRDFEWSSWYPPLWIALFEAQNIRKARKVPPGNFSPL